ncbi:MAG: tetratricopeptide repeat protein [Planctomycetaceae bacterium]|jgi:Flp pilus assembly protein TadD|nr:tetratricopeptide repeat protein [Planctomycetaceae bacterium]
MPTRDELELLLEADPDDVFLIYAVAMACASEGDPVEAVSRLERLTDVHPDYVTAWFQRGQLLAGLGRSDEARSVLVAGIAAASRDGDDHARQEINEFLESL